MRNQDISKNKSTSFLNFNYFHHRHLAFLRGKVKIGNLFSEGSKDWYNASSEVYKFHHHALLFQFTTNLAPFNSTYWTVLNMRIIFLAIYLITSMDIRFRFQSFGLVSLSRAECFYLLKYLFLTL